MCGDRQLRPELETEPAGEESLGRFHAPALAPCRGGKHGREKPPSRRASTASVRLRRFSQNERKRWREISFREQRWGRSPVPRPRRLMRSTLAAHGESGCIAARDQAGQSSEERCQAAAGLRWHSFCLLQDRPCRSAYDPIRLMEISHSRPPWICEVFLTGRNMH
jgi:hypothetical protein